MAKILCVEDEAALREDIVEELQDAGYATIEASNGREGIEAILGHNPDLVISDITMPVMDGYKFLTTLREQYPDFADIPFVFLSALADRNDIIDGKKLGADDYLTKPIDFDMLLVTVAARLRQVGRMGEHKHMQMVKLYKSLTGGAGSAPAPAGQSGTPASAETLSANGITIVTLAHVQDDLSTVHAVLKSAGQKVVKMDSAEKFFETLVEISPDLLLLSHRATDIPARVVAKKLMDSSKHHFPVILMAPAEQAKHVDLQSVPGISGLLKLPCERTVLAAIVAKLSSP